MRGAMVAGWVGRRTFGSFLATVVLVGASVAGSAVAAGAIGNQGGVVASYTDPTVIHPFGITLGPDGAMWFTNAYGDSIGRITTAGVITNFTAPSISSPTAITAGPDGALWFINLSVTGGSIGRITTSGVVTNYTDPSINTVGAAIVTGPDGALWFLNAYSIGRITTAGVVSHYTGSDISDVVDPVGLVAGPDGNMWFTNEYNHSIGRVTMAGVITNLTDPGITAPYGLAVGSDGALWFPNLSPPTIGRMTTAGAVTDYAGPAIKRPQQIAAGPDGALWFTNAGNNSSIGRITTAGVSRRYSDPTIRYPQGIAAGPDGAMWFANSSGGSIGRITTPPFDRVWSGKGPAGTAVNVSGGGFTPGETVKASYTTGLSAPNPAAVNVCHTTAVADGTFSCNGTIPTTNAGALGTHTIVAKGLTSLSSARDNFRLTTVLALPYLSYTSYYSGTQEVITINGTRFEAFGYDRVDVYDPDLSGYVYAWPTASVYGTFTVNVSIPKNLCRADVTIDAIQYAPVYGYTNPITDPGFC